jgi:hypothetical protein
MCPSGGIKLAWGNPLLAGGRGGRGRLTNGTYCLVLRTASGLFVDEIPQFLQRCTFIIVSALFVLLSHTPQLAFHRPPTLRRFAPLQLLGHLIQKSGVHENAHARSAVKLNRYVFGVRRGRAES